MWPDQAARPLNSQEILQFCETLESIRAAGVPLDFGLLHSAAQFPPRLAAVTEAIAARLQRGDSIEQALQDQQHAFPPLIKLLLVSGFHSPDAGRMLRELSLTGERMEDLRSAIRQGFIYPLLLLIVACGLAGYFARSLLPAYTELYQAMQIPLPWFTMLLTRFVSPLSLWGPWFFTFCGGLALTWITWKLLFAQNFWDQGACLPFIGSVIKQVRTARLAESLALLVNHGMPLPQALRLIADTTPLAREQSALRNFADLTEQGLTARPSSSLERPLTPLLRWLILSTANTDQLPLTLREAANLYRANALARADRLARLAPLFIALGLGACITLFYSFLLFLPMFELLRHMSQP